MVRTPCCDKRGFKKGTWTPEEDRKLAAYVTRYGCWNWRQLPKYAGLARCGKSCRLRWMNYLRPNIKRGNYTKEEDEIILRLHEQLGNKWSTIAAHLEGRTDNEIKNHWHTSLKKQSKEQSSQPSTPSRHKPKKGSSPSKRPDGQNSSQNNTPLTISTNHEILESSQWSPRTTSSVSLTSEEASSSTSSSPSAEVPTKNDEITRDETIAEESFWTEPFSTESYWMLSPPSPFPNYYDFNYYCSYDDDHHLLLLEGFDDL